MATGKSTTLGNNILDIVLGAGATPTFSSGVATVYVAAFTTTPAVGGGSGVEVSSSNNYSRVSVTNNATNWPAASAALKSNGTAITFPTASGSWGTVVGFGIYDASTSGNLLYFGPLLTSKTMGLNDVLSFSAGTLQITEN